MESGEWKVESGKWRVESGEWRVIVYRWVLASVSERRRKIFTDANIRIECADPGSAEDAVAAADTPEQLAIEKARAKARAVAARIEAPYPALVVAAGAGWLSSAWTTAGAGPVASVPDLPENAHQAAAATDDE